MVKTERLEFVIELLTSVMNHWVFFPLVMTAVGVSMRLLGKPAEGNPDFLLWTVCGLIPMVLFLVRYYVDRFWLFVLCHGGVLAVALAAAALLSTGRAVLCVACAAAYIIYSFLLRLKENASVYSGGIHPLTALGLTVAANFLFHREDGMPDWDRYYLFILIGVFACYLIIHYLKHYLSFLQVNKSSAGYLPAREILHSGIGFVLPYTLFGVLILLLSLNVAWLEPVLHVLKNGMIFLLRIFFMLLPRGEDAGEMIPMENAGANNASGLEGLPVGETFWLWEVLEYAAVILFFCGCTYVLFRAVKWLIRYVKEKFEGNQAGNRNLITGKEDVFDVREKCRIEKREPDSRHIGLFQRFTPVERVRRLYKKRILSGKLEKEDRGELNYMTAKECGDALSLPDMAMLYEQARYSDREITAEDVRRMKAACGGQVTRN